MDCRSWVQDFADVIELENARLIDQAATQLTKDTGAQLAVVAQDDLQGLYIEEYAFNLFNHWGLGDKERNDGLLVLLSPQNGEIHVMPGAGIDHVMTPEVLGGMLDDYAMPYLIVGEYGAGLLKLTEEMCRYYATLYADGIEYGTLSEPPKD